MHRLSTIFNEYQNKPFVWGKSDCCLFTADFVQVLTGIDPAKDYRNKYKTEIGAKRALVKYGSVEKALDEHFKRINYNFAKRGDPILFTSELGLTVGVKWSGGLLTMGLKGMVLVSEFEPEAVWSLGNV